MKPIINEIHTCLIKNKKSLSVAESCSGGLLCSLLTGKPLSSQYFILGIVAYSNSAKEKILKIPHRVIAKNGAVSEKVAKLMAKNIRKLAKTDLGIGITGIAGPSGGSLSKPVGTVFVAASSKKVTICKKFLFRGSRVRIRKKATQETLKLLNKLI